MHTGDVEPMEPAPHGTQGIDASRGPRDDRSQLIAGEFARSPIATLAAVLTLVSLVAGGVVAVVRNLSQEEVAIEHSSLSFRTGQSTSPNYVVPARLSELSRPPSLGSSSTSDQLNRWLVDHDAVVADKAEISFTAKGADARPSLVLGARAVVDRREKPLAGTWLRPTGGGPAPDRVLYVDLDEPVTVTRGPGWTFPLAVSDSEVEAFTVFAITESCHCSWHLELDVLTSDGDEITVLVTNHGRPFELTSSVGAVDESVIPATEDEPWP